MREVLNEWGQFVEVVTFWDPGPSINRITAKWQVSRVQRMPNTNAHFTNSDSNFSIQILVHSKTEHDKHIGIVQVAVGVSQEKKKS